MPDDLTARVTAALKDLPTAPLEAVAAQAQSSVADVIRALPAEEATCVDGSHFVEAMQAMRDWGEVTLIVNTGDVILEAKAPLPDGSLGHGYYNLHGKPVGGHLKADACAMVAFVSRQMMARMAHSVQFYNHAGACMFKVYLGRDAERNFLPGQEDAFKALRDRLSA